jgi:hypothetical protein
MKNQKETELAGFNGVGGGQPAARQWVVEVGEPVEQVGRLR